MSQVRLLCLYCILLFASTFVPTTGLKATFTPSSDDEQLPLSAKYRQSLRKLCTVLLQSDATKNVDLLPLDMRSFEQRAQLRKKCLKLAQDDSHVGGGSTFSPSSPGAWSSFAVTAAGLGGAFFLWNNRNRWFGGGGGGGGIEARGGQVLGGQDADATTQNLDAMRDVRLKRFEMSPTQTVVSGN
jgi:hypothetical protein